MPAGALPEDGQLVGPVELKGRLLGGPHGMLVRENDITLVQLPGRSRLWIVVLPGVFLAWFLRGLLPEALPVTTTYLLIVILVFYAGDRWSKATTRRSMDELTVDQAASEPDERIHLPQLVNADTEEPLFGGRVLVLETATSSWRLEIPHEDWETVERVLDEHDPGSP